MAEFIPSLERRLYHFIAAAEYRPMKTHELIRALRLPADQRRAVRHALRALETQGRVTRIRKNRWAVPRTTAEPLTGVLTVQPGGFGFVTVEGQTEDVFIPPRQLGVALHGDRVDVVITRTRSGRPSRHRRRRKMVTTDDADRRLSGRIVAVRERRLTRLAGVLKVARHYRYVIPDHPRVSVNLHVQAVAKGLEPLPDGHRVVVELLEWTTPGTPAPGRVIEDLGPADAPGSDMLGLLHSHGLDETFPPPVEKAVAKLQPVRSATDTVDSERRDLRDRCLITIDPEDARDFDDAVSLRRNADGNWELGVHIADVPAYVTAGTKVDKEAHRRGTSVYLVDRVITMLPRHLTKAVCSLSPDVDRLAHTVDITLSPRGRILDVATYPSLIRSATRLDYDTVQAVLDDASSPANLAEPVHHMLRDMRTLAQCLRRKRARHGSILFVMPEVRCVLDAQGQPTAIVPRRAYAAYQLIEEFMLLANQAVARRIADAGYPCIYRVHPPPDEKQWEQMAADLAALGHELPDLDRAGMNAVAAAVSGEPSAHITHLAMLRNLKRAFYAAERADHFGLAFDHYLHFTSPIRRYPDLIAHRVLNAVEQGAPPPYSQQELNVMAAHCSDMERQAAEAEQESVDLKRMAFYARLLKDGHTGPFDALVTGETGRGLLVELRDTLQRGLIPFALLRSDHGRPRHPRSARRNRRPSWGIGDVLEVELVRVDEGRKWVDFAPWKASRAGGKRKG